MIREALIPDRPNRLLSHEGAVRLNRLRRAFIHFNRFSANGTATVPRSVRFSD
jgi:hypothetical protein